MKKIYQAPCVNVTYVHIAEMLATSIAKYGTGADDGVVLTKEYNNEWANIWDK